MTKTIDALVEALEPVATWMEQSANCSSGGPDHPPEPTSQFDYELLQAASEIRAALAQARAEQAEPGEMPDAMRDFIEGMEVSVDVSTCEWDAQNRYFGLVSEVMDNPDSKHGVILLVQNSEPNFTPPAAPVAKLEPLTVTEVERIHQASYNDTTGRKHSLVFARALEAAHNAKLGNK